MPCIMNSFIEFMEVNKNKFQNVDIDLSTLLEIVNHCTPITLKHSDPEDAFIHMPSVILMNFFKNHGGTKYPMNGLIALRDIVTKSVDDEDSRLVMMLMVHVTKMHLPINYSVLCYQSFSNLTGNVQTTDSETWQILGYQVLAHKNLKNTINELLQRSFGQQFANRIEETNSIQISVNVFDHAEEELRGFAGINGIYINYGHFYLKQVEISRYDLSESEKENLLLIDIATVVIHEYAHVRARQITDDFNHTTPKELITTIDERDPEFGRMAERELFRDAINWVKSFRSKAVSAVYIAQFLNAIKENIDLPAFPADSRVIPRCGGGGGADIAYPPDIVIE